MSAPDAARLLAALEATWPPAAARRLGPWLLREGGGGGRRVSAASAVAPAGADDIAAAEAAMRDAGEAPLFRLTPALAAWDAALDAALEARGYLPDAPTILWLAPVDRLAPAPLSPMKAFALWPPLAIQHDIWAAAGIGPARLAVMGRVQGPHTALMAREADRVAGTAFVACDGEVGLLHALEVPERARRRGVGRNLLQAAAEWARGQGAGWLALAVTDDNAPAAALYAGAGMAVAGRYHYRRAAPAGRAHL